MAADPEIYELTTNPMPQIMTPENMPSADHDELRTYEAWMLEDPEQRLQDLADILQTPEMSQRQPTQLPEGNKWRKLLDPSYRFDFDDDTEDELYAIHSIRSLIDENRTTRKTTEQSRRSFVQLRVLRMGAFLLRAAEARRGSLPLQQSAGRIAIESLLQK